MTLARKGSGPSSRIPLPTGRYFLNLSPSDIPQPRTPAGQNNLRPPPKSGGVRRPNLDRSLPLESPSSHRVLTPVGSASRDVLASSSRDVLASSSRDVLASSSRDVLASSSREILDIPKATATSLTPSQPKATVIEANVNINSNEV
jgi:hypothetical protein